MSEEAYFLEDVPECSRRAPVPMLLVGQHHLHLAYRMHMPPDDAWDGSTCRVVSENTENEECCLVSFHGPTAHKFERGGFDYGSGTHPLEGAGLEAYALYEIEGSKWAVANGGLRHFVFMFHDTTFECVAESYSFRTERSSVSSLVRSPWR